MSNEVLKKMLEQSKREKRIIGITNYKDSDKFWVGYVVDFNNDFLIFQHITKFGLKDGLNIEEISNIQSIETDEDYLNGVWYFIDNPLPEQTVKSINLPSDNNWQYDMLNGNPTPDKVIALEVSSDSDVYGIILDLDEEFFSIRKVSNSGADEGIVFSKVTDINAIQFDTLEARRRQKLYEWSSGRH